MISLSKEWSILSKALYGEKFIDELANFLHKYNVMTILECGCGDGYILHGLADRGLRGIGIDSNKEMIDLAQQNHNHLNVKFLQMSWLDLDNLDSKFDLVMCRGNSLAYVSSWDKNRFNPKKVEYDIEKSIRLFISKLNLGGLLYVDTFSENENKDLMINIEDITMRGHIKYNYARKTREVSGHGKLGDEEFQGGSQCYLLTSNKLEKIISKNDPTLIFKPKLVHEINYEIICAIK